jgi:hypothetical protein
VLALQVELCEVLLDEISGIRSSLAKDLKETRAGAMPTFDDTATKEFYFPPEELTGNWVSAYLLTLPQKFHPALSSLMVWGGLSNGNWCLSAAL